MRTLGERLECLDTERGWAVLSYFTSVVKGQESLSHPLPLAMSAWYKCAQRGSLFIVVMELFSVFILEQICL